LGFAGQWLGATPMPSLQLLPQLGPKAP